MAQLVQGNPVTVAIAASSSCFQYYGGGLLNCDCSGVINHVVLVTGWGPKYWTIRNQVHSRPVEWRLTSSSSSGARSGATTATGT
jgi:hypothetical protein